MSRSRVVGLDVGTSAVRAAEVEFSGGGPGRGHATLARFAQVPLPPGSVQDAEVSQPETVATALKQLWRDGGFSSRDVVLGIGSQRVVVRDLELPFGPMTQLRASLPYQVQELLPMPVEEALLDYYPPASSLSFLVHRRCPRSTCSRRRSAPAVSSATSSRGWASRSLPRS